MKKILLAGTAAAALIFATGAAQAADIAPEPPMTDWSGFYIGGHVGFGAADMSGCYDCDDDSSALFAEDLDLDGLLGGVHAGVNFAMDNVVFGIEGDVTFTDMKDDSPEPDDDDDVQRGDIDLLASVRARLGVVTTPDVLAYVTAGIAIPDASWEADDIGEAVDFDDIGGVVGVGFEFAASDTIRWRAEALYYFFDEDQDVGHFPDGNDGEAIELDDVLVIRGGVSFYLNI